MKTKHNRITKRKYKIGGGLFSRYSNRKKKNDILKDELNILDKKMDRSNVDSFMAYFKQKQFDPNAYSSNYGRYWNKQCKELINIIDLNMQKIQEIQENNTIYYNNILYFYRDKIAMYRKLIRFLNDVKNKKQNGISHLYPCIHKILDTLKHIENEMVTLMKKEKYRLMLLEEDIRKDTIEKKENEKFLAMNTLHLDTQDKNYLPVGEDEDIDKNQILADTDKYLTELDKQKYEEEQLKRRQLDLIKSLPSDMKEEIIDKKINDINEILSKQNNYVSDPLENYEESVNKIKKIIKKMKSRKSINSQRDLTDYEENDADHDGEKHYGGSTKKRRSRRRGKKTKMRKMRK